MSNVVAFPKDPPSFAGWSIERIKLALTLYGFLESALEPARSRRGDRAFPSRMDAGASIPPAGTVCPPAGGFSS